MAKFAYFDCLSGIAGDMTLAALIDAGADQEQIQTALVSLGLPELQLHTEEVKKCGFRALHLQVKHPPEHAHRHLRDALRSFRKRDVGLAKSTVASASQFTRYFDKVFDDLAHEGEANSRPSSELFALMAAFNRLERIIHQAKNICEETAFVVNGQTKGEKTFTILFLDRDNTGASQLAEHFTAKAFPNSGRYRSAGLEPGEIVAPNYREFAQSVGIDMARAWPVDFESLREELIEFDLIIGLEPSLRNALGRLPFHTNMLTWSIELEEGPESVYRQLTPKIRELMELLRGEQAS